MKKHITATVNNMKRETSNGYKKPMSIASHDRSFFRHVSGPQSRSRPGTHKIGPGSAKTGPCDGGQLQVMVHTVGPWGALALYKSGSFKPHGLLVIDGERNMLNACESIRVECAYFVFGFT